MRDMQRIIHLKDNKFQVGGTIVIVIGIEKELDEGLFLL